MQDENRCFVFALCSWPYYVVHLEFVWVDLLHIVSTVVDDGEGEMHALLWRLLFYNS